MLFSSALQRAIKRGLKPGGDLVAELRKLDDYTIRSKGDARAICQALASLPLLRLPEDDSYYSPLHAVTSLFQEVEGPQVPAFQILSREGLPLLIQIFDARVQAGNEEDGQDLLFLLKILAMYGSREGAEKVVEAARKAVDSDGYLWHVILELFAPGHPQRDYVFQALSDPLPSGFIAIALLDSANQSAIKGELTRHPFDSPEGERQLRSWLTEANPEKFSYAHSATVALPFLKNPARNELLHLAMDHADVGVQLEAAWAAAKVGRDAGLRLLAKYCLDVSHSSTAKRYLSELGHEDLIPPEASDPAFQAKSEFANWLAHPNELGRAPDELEVVDHRLLAWPPEKEPRPFWILKYRMRDQTGLNEDDIDCGLVGSMTWCFFTYQMVQRPPEDVYAIHCYWEMQHEGLIDETEVTDPTEYAQLLSQWTGPPLESATITDVAEISPKLNTPARFVGLATARLNGEEGWVVLDGPRSAWYPKAEQPNQFCVILMIHIGRQLLGFQDLPERKKYLQEESPKRSPAAFAAAYEKLMNEVPDAPSYRQKELLCERLLINHFDRYIDSVSELQGVAREGAVIEVYEKFLTLASQADESIRDDCYDSHALLGQEFNTYVAALVASGRGADVIPWLEKFAPYWEHNLGYFKLGRAAFLAGKHEVAERFLILLREGMEAYYRSETMSMLAEIWFNRGEIDQAQALLIDCQEKLLKECQESKYDSDRKRHAKDFHHHQTTFLRLFPQGKDLLTQHGIPESPL